MDLNEYLAKTGETILGFGSRAGVSHATVRSVMRKNYTVTARTAIKIEVATEGQVNAMDLMGDMESYEPVDPMWREWWENRPGKEERERAPKKSPTKVTRKPRAVG